MFFLNTFDRDKAYYIAFLFHFLQWQKITGLIIINHKTYGFSKLIIYLQLKKVNHKNIRYAMIIHIHYMCSYCTQYTLDRISSCQILLTWYDFDQKTSKIIWDFKIHYKSISKCKQCNNLCKQSANWTNMERHRQDCVF